MELLDAVSTKRILKKYKVPLTNTYIASNKAEVLKSATKIGYPVVIKIDSPDIIHKTDVGGVIAGINNREELKVAYDTLMENIKKNKPDAKINGALISRMESGVEVIIGAKHDSQFGGIIMFGLGGVFVEVLKDVVLRVAPVTEKEAMRMIDEIHGRAMLEGTRGTKAISKTRLASVISKVSNIIVKEKNIREIDLNPVMADERKAVVVDMRVLIDKI